MPDPGFNTSTFVIIMNSNTPTPPAPVGRKKNNDNPHVNPAGRDIVRSLALVGDGALLTEASEKIREAAKAVNQYGGTAELTLKVKIKGQHRNSDAVALSGTVTVKKPEKPKMPTIAFADEEGDISLTDQKQGDFRDITGFEEAPKKTAAAEAAE